MTQNLKNLIITVTLEESFTTSIYLCSTAFLIKWEHNLTVYGIETLWVWQQDVRNKHVATALTVYGIETQWFLYNHHQQGSRLQQYLPFTVLKQRYIIENHDTIFRYRNSPYRLRYWNSFAVLLSTASITLLQQCLPFTVLKRIVTHRNRFYTIWLQQCLPFTVLKRFSDVKVNISILIGVATVLTVYGIETFGNLPSDKQPIICCNSAYRLRYWNTLTLNSFLPNALSLQQYLSFTILKLSLDSYAIRQNHL